MNTKLSCHDKNTSKQFCCNPLLGLCKISSVTFWTFTTSCIRCWKIWLILQNLCPFKKEPPVTAALCSIEQKGDTALFYAKQADKRLLRKQMGMSIRVRPACQPVCAVAHLYHGSFINCLWGSSLKKQRNVWLCKILRGHSLSVPQLKLNLLYSF